MNESENKTEEEAGIPRSKGGMMESSSLKNKYKEAAKCEQSRVRVKQRERQNFHAQS